MQISGKSFAAGVLVTMVLGSGTAYAATGGNLIIGRSNSASTTTTLTNTTGSALALNTPSGHAPLKVNRGTKVGNLNADYLDGLDSTKLALSTAGTGAFWSVEVFEFDTDDDLVMDTTAAWADCPPGTVVTGGSAFSYAGAVVVDSFKDGNSWLAITPTVGETASAENFGANVVCWNPKGPLADQAFRTAPDAELRSAARAAR